MQGVSTMIDDNENTEAERLVHSGVDERLDEYVAWLVPKYEDGVTEMSFSVVSEGKEAFGMVFLSCEMFTTDNAELESLRGRLVMGVDKYIAHMKKLNEDDDSETSASA